MARSFCACAAVAIDHDAVERVGGKWYRLPGHGKALTVRIRGVVHAGRSLAVVRTELKTTAGERVLEVVTQLTIARKARV